MAALNRGGTENAAPAAELEALAPDVRELCLRGYAEICPVCLEVSAYAWQDTDAYDEFENGIIPGAFRPAPGSVAHIPASSGLGEWQCGHCGAHLVAADSPLLAECYTHVDYGALEED